MSESIIKFRTIPAGKSQFFGVATLNSPASLNSLSADMVTLLTPQLRKWADDKSVVGVLFDAEGEKAFCAGGDMRQLYNTLLKVGRQRNEYAEQFFGEEYELDHLLHNYPKPLMCWGHGIVMGGGVGLLVGASHRVVTEGTRLAMPEINIGLYPDVGGTWFLARAPQRLGLFLGLTAAQVNASDAIYTGLADHFVPHGKKAGVLESIAAATWSDDASANREVLSEILHAAGVGENKPASKLKEHEDTINTLLRGNDILAIAKRINAFTSDDKWLQGALTAFTKGAPSSVVLTWELWRRCQRMSLAEVFRLEYWVSLGCCAHADLPEGIRAVLVDKDRNPKWDPARLEDVTVPFIADHFEKRGEMPEILANLK
ncbi:enoyl-CoA hydratase/isomerase family protein [Pseudorhodoferax soli]|uniref:3-hydroxyisobutyryl-CoA hydrolase n=1 Tax=Pseudorhodoferax soli TaxID=545864 RepID=A0A368XKT7_9BURK|nr:enoyl-CoA hydratase/isomerase family protein [Pseudorhodoferax soli]RCW68641.1 enoyl-CoA hydratase/isomerase-like protein [Pseudorhodoferax soli]